MAHAESIAALHALAFPPDEAWSADAFATQLALPGVFAFLTDAGFVLARVAADEAEIITIAVAPVARLAGLGRLLLAAAEVVARDRGAARMFLEVAEANVAARKLYAAAGYVEVGRRAHYYGTIDALVLRRDLAS